VAPSSEISVPSATRASSRNSRDRGGWLELFCALVDEVRFEDDVHLPDAERRRLRRVRLHDLRHGQASLMLAAGIEMAIVSKRLGHSGSAITSDTYSHLLGGVGRDAAEKAAALIPRRRKEQAQPVPSETKIEDPGSQSVPSEAAEAPSALAPETAEPPLTQVNEGSDPEGSGRPCGTRTHNQRIKSPLLCQLS